MNITKQKMLNFVVTLKAGGQKFPKTFFQVLERQNMKNQTIFELHTDDNKSKYSRNPMKILKSAKKYESLRQEHLHIDCPITSTSTLTFHKTKIEQMSPCE